MYTVGTMKKLLLLLPLIVILACCAAVQVNWPRTVPIIVSLLPPTRASVHSGDHTVSLLMSKDDAYYNLGLLTARPTGQIGAHNFPLKTLVLNSDGTTQDGVLFPAISTEAQAAANAQTLYTALQNP